jgi:hypothetical protein
MAIIKSAFEIAMENSRSVEVDRDSLETKKFVTEGKKIASRFIDGSVADIKQALKNLDRSRIGDIKEGVMEALLSNLVLPADEFGLKKTEKVGEGLFAVVSDGRTLGRLMGELEHFFQEYLEERKRLKEAVDAQYAPKLREKEEQMAKQLGAPVKIDPASDPEYGAFLRKNMVRLEDRYGQVLTRVKEEIRKLFG